MPRKGKCFSSCQKRPKSECEPSECYYTKGNEPRYRYCRLAFTRKMNSECVPFPKTPEKNLTAKSLTAKSLAAKSLTAKSLTAKRRSMSREEKSQFRKKVATRKIGRFFRKYEPRVRSKFLQSVCSDAGVCIAFGTHADAIRTHFNDFSDFHLLSKHLKQIGAVSANGFVKELEYEHKGYRANAILKSSTKPNADNLLYEALVGFFLNKQSKSLPCFLETYGLYKYTENITYVNLKTMRENRPELLQSGLKRIAEIPSEITDSIIRRSSRNPVSLCVLIQHLKEAQTLENMCQSPVFVRNDLVYVLFQVYMALHTLAGSFTHYDLHNSNVLVYKPVKGKYIEYHYHLEDGTEFTFKSPYIAKIIDYGRCYYREDKSSNSKTFLKKLCSIDPSCGIVSGYGWLNKLPNTSSYFISSQTYNSSHDLRLLKILSTLKGRGMEYGLRNIMNKVVYVSGLSNKNLYYGTKSNNVSGLPKRINNVSDAYRDILSYAKTPEVAEHNAIGYGNKANKLGELHIYSDRRPMKYRDSASA